MDLTVVIVGIPAAFGGGWWLHKRLSVNYHKRWREALTQLDVATGGLDKAVSAEERNPPPPKKKKKTQIGQGMYVNVQVKGLMRVQVDPAVRDMATWDRRKLEIERARNGLPPADDLEGMASWDKRKVLEARARYRGRS